MTKRDSQDKNESVHFGQIFFDDMFLLLLLGVAFPFMVYTVWGLMDTGSIPQLPPTPFSATASATPPSSGTDKIAQGEHLAQQFGCLSCHSTDGTTRIGPTWKGLFGSSVPLTNGTVITADSAFLKESILNANATTVQGFAPTMPSYEGRLSSEELDALVAYIQSLK
jgi:mono/diheme cytochrome c family protein